MPSHPTKSIKNDLTAACTRTAHKSIRLMTHMVAGYPDIQTNIACAKLMATYGVDLIEIQIPFSDPLADGPTIMRANHQALANGMTPTKSFELIATITEIVKIPVIVMTYYNIPYKHGLDNFLNACTQAKASGVILPDIPYDEKRENYLATLAKYPLHPILVISPQISPHRLNAIQTLASGFIYTTLRVGITGAQKNLSPATLDYLTTLKTLFSCPIAAGFGLSTPQQLHMLKDYADIAVMGSQLINILEDKGLNGIEDFLRTCQKVLSA